MVGPLTAGINKKNTKKTVTKTWRLFGVVWGLFGGSLGLARPSPHPPAPTRAVSGAQLLDFERKLPWECTTFVFFELFFDSDTKNTLF